MVQKPNLIKWAHENYEDFLVVCGLKNSGTKCNIRILEALQNEGFEELTEMMTLRVIQLMFEDDPKSVQAEKKMQEGLLKRKKKDF